MYSQNFDCSQRGRKRQQIQHQSIVTPAACETAFVPYDRLETQPIFCINSRMRDKSRYSSSNFTLQLPTHIASNAVQAQIKSIEMHLDTLPGIEEPESRIGNPGSQSLRFHEGYWIESGRNYITIRERSGPPVVATEADQTIQVPVPPNLQSITSISAPSDGLVKITTSAPFYAIPNSTQVHLLDIPLASVSQGPFAVQTVSGDGSWFTVSATDTGIGSAVPTGSQTFCGYVYIPPYTGPDAVCAAINTYLQAMHSGTLITSPAVKQLYNRYSLSYQRASGLYILRRESKNWIAELTVDSQSLLYALGFDYGTRRYQKRSHSMAMGSSGSSANIYEDAKQNDIQFYSNSSGNDLFRAVVPASLYSEGEGLQQALDTCINQPIVTAANKTLVVVGSDGERHTLSLTEGPYTTTTLCSALQSLLDTNLPAADNPTVEYSHQSHCFTISVTSGSLFEIDAAHASTTSHNLLGLSSRTYSGASSYVSNPVYYPEPGQIRQRYWADVDTNKNSVSIHTGGFGPILLQSVTSSSGSTAADPRLTVTCSSPHPFSVGDVIRFAGVSGSQPTTDTLPDWFGLHVVAAVPSHLAFDIHMVTHTTPFDLSAETQVVTYGAVGPSNLLVSAYDDTARYALGYVEGDVLAQYTLKAPASWQLSRNLNAAIQLDFNASESSAFSSGSLRIFRTPRDGALGTQVRAGMQSSNAVPLEELRASASVSGDDRIFTIPPIPDVIPHGRVERVHVRVIDIETGHVLNLHGEELTIMVQIDRKVDAI